MSKEIIKSVLVGEDSFTAARVRYWNQNTDQMNRWGSIRRYYRERLIEIYQFLIPKGSRVLELGSGHGDLLAGVLPSYGVGVDFSPLMVEQANVRYPHLSFVEMDAQALILDEKFDYVICSDLLNELWNVQAMLKSLASVCHPETRIILNLHSNLWQSPRRIAAKLGFARPQMIQNWLAPEDIANLLYLTNFEIIRKSSEILWPLRTPFFDSFCNRFLVKLWPFSFFGLTNVVIVRPKPKPPVCDVIVTVIVPARGEAGNIAAIFDRVPHMGRGTELIFVEGGSDDDTYGSIEREMTLRQRPMTKLLQQVGKGKGDAVRCGAAHAIGDVIMILDADLTVSPEDLPHFYEAWLTGKGDFINGVRMVYPMGERAMRFLNMVGNKFFSLAFSYLLGQKVKDTACGTKTISLAQYNVIIKNRDYFGEFDRFGDWDMLFGAAKLNLKIIDLPIRYYERVYGETKMQRWRIGGLLLRMVFLGLRRLKFV